MDREKWKDIPDYENLYQASNLGKIKNIKTNKLLKEYNNNGYNNVILCKNGNVKYYKVHRLIAKTFIPNINNYPCVNHKDEDKNNNNSNNLEWCTWEYNNNYGHRNKKISKKLSKKVIQYDMNGDKIKKWKSVSEVERKLKISNSNITKCCNGKRKTAGGYIWEYE